MRTKHRKSSVLIALLLCVASVMGCASSETTQVQEVTPMEREEANAVSFSFIGGNDVMPIGGYYGPMVSYTSRDGNTFQCQVTDETMKMIADAGLNVITYSDLNYSSFPGLVKSTLELGEKYGVGIFVNDTAVTNHAGKEEISAAELSEQIVNYADYPAFCGLYVTDEPGTAYYQPGKGTNFVSKYVKLANTLQYNLGLTCYMNMWPIGKNYNTQKESYEKYVEEFCETLNPKVIMWDHYPFDNKDGSADGYQTYFWNMDLMRQQSEKRGVPFWSYIQAGHQWNDYKEYFDSSLPYYPNEAQFDWNINTSLAFGAKGIQYFPIFQPAHFAYAKSTEWDFQRNALLGVVGNKNQWYFYAQNINKHIAAIDEVLMNSVNKGIIVTGKQAKTDVELTTCVIESGQFQELLSVDGDTMIGCFNYNGKTALYVVNYSMEHAQNITLNLNKEHDIKMIQNAETSYVKAQNLQLDMAAGEGVLVVIE